MTVGAVHPGTHFFLQQVLRKGSVSLSGNQFPGAKPPTFPVASTIYEVRRQVPTLERIKRRFKWCASSARLDLITSNEKNQPTRFHPQTFFARPRRADLRRKASPRPGFHASEFAHTPEVSDRNHGRRRRPFRLQQRRPARYFSREQRPPCRSGARAGAVRPSRIAVLESPVPPESRRQFHRCHTSSGAGECRRWKLRNGRSRRRLRQ